jgi:hypothetical protein
MLGSGDTRERGNSFEEETDVVVGGEAPATCIDLCITTGCAKPADNVLQHALLKLMEDVGDNGLVDVEERQGLPERRLDRPNVGLPTSLRENGGTFFDSCKGGQNGGRISRTECRIPLAALFSVNWASWAIAGLDESCEQLLGVVAYKCGKNGVTSTHSSVGAGEFDTMLPGFG